MKRRRKLRHFASFFCKKKKRKADRIPFFCFFGAHFLPKKSLKKVVFRPCFPHFPYCGIERPSSPIVFFSFATYLSPPHSSCHVCVHVRPKPPAEERREALWRPKEDRSIALPSLGGGALTFPTYENTYKKDRMERGADAIVVCVCVDGAYFSRDGRKRRRRRRSMGRGKRSNNILLGGGERGGSNKFGVCS